MTIGQLSGIYGLHIPSNTDQVSHVSVCNSSAYYLMLIFYHRVNAGNCIQYW